jgi:hypothetical protein
MSDPEEILKEITGNLCLSGGADGSDLQWGMMAGRIGHYVIHWSFTGHRSGAPEQELVRLSSDQLLRADDALSRANLSLKRRWPNTKPWIANLLRRNWYQVNWTGGLYAVGSMKKNKIEGGTAWATQMYMDRFSENPHDARLFFFDQEPGVWKKWTGEWEILTESPPLPSGIWTGIGTRDLKDSGKWAIRNVMGGYESPDL